MKKHLVLFALALLSAMLKSQTLAVPSALESFRTTSGTQNTLVKTIVKIDASKNVYTAGATITANGTMDILITKVNSAGVFQWSKQYNGPANQTDFATELVIDASGNIFVTGVTTNDTSANHYTDLILLKLNSSGVQQFVSFYDGGTSNNDAGADVKVDGTGNIYCTGSSVHSTDCDFITVGYNSSGTQLWASVMSYSAGLNDAGVRMTLGGGIVTVVGVVQTTATDFKAAIVTYTKTTGAQQSFTVTSSSASGIDQVTCAQTDISGNIYVGGAKTISGHGLDGWLTKLTSSLTVIFDHTYNGASNLDDVIQGMDVDATGTVFTTGYTTTSSNGTDIWSMKCDGTTGNASWTKTFDDVSHGNDAGASLKLDASVNVYLTGYAKSVSNGLDYYTMKLDNSGNTVWSIQTDGNGLDDQANALALDTNVNVVVAGSSKLPDNTYQYITVKYEQKDVITPTDYNLETPSANFLYYPNRGQLTAATATLTSVPDIKYYTNHTNPLFYFKNTGQSFVFSKIDTARTSPSDTCQRIDLTFMSSNESAETFAMNEQDKGYLNYFLAQTGSAGVAGIKGNQRLITPNLYSNIDLMCSSNRNGIKYYFIVKPGGDMRNINMNFAGATSYSLNGTTNFLSVNSTLGKVIFDRPVAYQLTAANTTVAVTGWTPDWQTNGASNKYKFNTGTYTSSLTLVIEVDQGNALASTLSSSVNCQWSTYVGGANADQPNDVISDAANNLFVTGYTTSSNYPLVAGVQVFQNLNLGNADGFIDKYSNVGERLFSTYVGGTQDDKLKSIAIAPSGDIYVVGQTMSTLTTLGKSGATSTLTALGALDVFILQVSPDSHSKRWLTYYGGSNDDEVLKCKFDVDGNFFMVGKTYSKNLPIIGSAPQYTNTNNDAVTYYSEGYVVKFNTASQTTWATFVGSSIDSLGGEYNDGFYDIDFDSNKDVYVAGFSEGSNYPYMVNGNSTNFHKYPAANNSDGVLTRFSNTGQLKFSTYVGSSSYDYFNALKIRGNKICLTGQKQGVNFPLKNSHNWYYSPTYIGVDNAIFVLFDTNDSLLHSTYIHGNSSLIGTDIEIDTVGKVYVSGITTSTVLPPLVSQPTGSYEDGFKGGSSDMFIYALAPGDTTIVWGTDIGGTNDEGYGLNGFCFIDINKQNSLHLVGSTLSNTSFPLFNGIAGTTYFDDTYNSGIDATITKFYLYPINLISDVKTIQSNTIASFLAYPNPTQSIINVKLNSSTDKAFYYIYNTLGQTVREGVFDKGTEVNPIELSDLTGGLYILEVIQNNQKASVKFIKHG